MYGCEWEWRRGDGDEFVSDGVCDGLYHGGRSVSWLDGERKVVGVRCREGGKAVVVVDLSVIGVS